MHSIIKFVIRTLCGPYILTQPVLTKKTVRSNANSSLFDSLRIGNARCEKNNKISSVEILLILLHVQ